MTEPVSAARQASLGSLQADRLSIVYDGECPFCSAYVRLMRLRDSAGQVDLIDARGRPDLCEELRQRGIDLNKGMLVQHGGRIYLGADALNIMALLTSRSNLWNKAVAGIMADEGRARMLYPTLRAGRNLALRLLGRKPI